MNFLLSDITEKFYTILWPFIRISSFLLAVPVLSINAVNIQLRILISVVLTFMIFPLISVPIIDPISSDGLFEVFNQILIGVTMGFILQIVTAAIVVGGQSISNAMGLGMANMIDPNIGNVPVISQFLIILSSLIFVGFGGHVILINLLLDSFNLIPVGIPFIGQLTSGSLIEWSSMIFLGAVLLSLPIMITMLFINIGVGIITRAAPSLNIFAVGFPAFLLSGFIIIIVSMGIISNRIEWLWIRSFEILRNIIGIS